MRLSLKLFNVAPDQLAPGVKEQVLALVTQDPVSSIRREQGGRTSAMKRAS